MTSSRKEDLVKIVPASDVLLAALRRRGWSWVPNAAGTRNIWVKHEDTPRGRRCVATAELTPDAWYRDVLESAREIDYPGNCAIGPDLQWRAGVVFRWTGDDWVEVGPDCAGRLGFSA